MTTPLHGSLAVAAFGPDAVNPFGLDPVSQPDLQAHPTFVGAATPDGAYGAGTVITLTVKFSGTVFVDDTAGSPTLSLETGATDRDAIYSGGSGTDTLTFVYTVQAGDNSADLDVTGPAALQFNGSTIRSASGDDAVLTVAEPGHDGSLSSSAALVIDTTAPDGWVDTVLVQDNSGAVSVAGSEAGTAYLVKDDVLVIDVDSITGAPDSSWNEIALHDAFIREMLPLAGLDDGTYHVFVVDAAGNLSGPGLGYVEIDSTPPVATLTPAVVSHSGTVTVQMSEPGSAVLVNTDSVFSDVDGIAALSHDSWTAVPIDDADTDTAMSVAGLREGTYKLYAIDNAGNLSAPSIGSITVDLTPPHGTVVGGASFRPPVVNPFSLPGAQFQWHMATTFADLDGDGDKDLVIGKETGDVVVFTNIGTPHNPVFDTTPTLLASVPGGFAHPAFADIDGDGDLDAFVGDYDGRIHYFENTGSPSNAVFSGTAVDEPFGLQPVASFSSPVFADLDGDGDLDAVVAAGGGIEYFENTGDARHPVFAAPVSDPFGFGPLGLAPSVSFVDIDGDGDLDAFAGSFYSPTAFHRNIGTKSAPQFDSPVSGAFDLSGPHYLGVSFVDIDGDGDPDAFIAAGDSPSLLFFENNSAVEPVGSSSADGTYTAGAGIVLTVHFSETVYVHTGAGSPTLVLETGLVDAEAQYIGGSGTNTLTFVYTVQAGDSSPDLDAYALKLNGATIQDEAGNDAVIAFAAPGATGSLSATHAIVVDALAPVATLVVAGAVNSNTTTNARVQSTEKGMAYLVNVNVAVTDVASITAAADSDWNQTSINAANATRLFSLSGLSEGTYKLYTADAAGNLSPASTATLVIDNTAPVATVATVSAKNTGTVKVQSNETGVAYLVNSGLTVTDAASITSQADALWNKANITAAGVDKVLSLAGLADGDYKLYVVDAAGNVSAPSSGTVTVDSAAPHVVSVSSADADSTYRVGQTITLSVTFTEAVNVTGTPSLLLETGTVDHSATYIGGSGSNVLQFSYTVHAGDFSSDLEAAALRGGTIRDAAGNNAVPTLPGAGGVGSLSAQSDFHVDGIDDVLVGTAGADRLSGGVGADTMTGGDGSDIYRVDNTGDVVIETNADTLTGGIDTIVSTASSYTLSANVERGIIATNAAADLTGNSLDNILTAGGGDNGITGAGGNDLLTGGDGADRFVFDDIASGTDKIRDFSVSQGDLLVVLDDVNGSGIVDGASALAHVHDVSGNAVLDLGGGNTVVLLGVHTADLSAASFVVFDAR